MRRILLSCLFRRRRRRRTKREYAEEPELPWDVREAFRKYAGGGSYMTAEQFQRFLRDVQKERGASARQISGLYHHTKFTLDDFHQYLLSPDNLPIGTVVHQDMNAPLLHYFIFTGYNSYLTSEELSSSCSDIPIIEALKRGVRVVELDVWPNSTKDNVLVLHGRILTPPVELARCLRSIRDHAFLASPYPVIIILEDHLTPDLRGTLSEMLAQTFGDMLYYPHETPTEFPSPEALKHRVIISTKPPKEFLEAKTSQEDVDSYEDKWGKDCKADQLQGNESQLGTSEQNQDNGEQSLRPVYKSLIAIQAVKPKGGMKEALKVEINKVRGLSLIEQALEETTKSHSLDIVRFTQKNLLRVYPKGTQFNSNYDPLVGWLHGAQMVAFNMQGYGECLCLMHGLFRANGGCGYVKKPEILMNDNLVFDPKAKAAVQRTLRVRQFRAYEWRLGFRAKVEIVGVPADAARREPKVAKVTWDEEFEFPLTVPELALLRITASHHVISPRGDYLEQTVLPVWELKQGIRAIPLHDRQGEKSGPVELLMRFEFT